MPTLDPFEFSNDTIEALPAAEPGKRIQARDTRMSRLYVRVTDTGYKSFYYVRKVAGRTEWLRLGAFPEMKVGVARSAAEREGAKFVGGENPAEERRKARAESGSTPTLGGLWKVYKAAYSSGATRGGGRSPKTLNSQWNVWLSRWEGRKIDSITDRMVEVLRDEIRDKRSAVMANKILRHGSAMYSFAARSKRIKYAGINPFALVEKFPEKRSRKQRLKQADVARFFAGLETASPAMRDLFLCCLFIGARSGNVKAMRWEDLDLEGGVWTIPITKTGDSHEVSLAEPVVEILKERQKSVSGEWVFPARSKSGHIESYRKAWIAVCKKAGIRELRVHDLRRTLSSWAQEAKVSVALVQAQLGHLDPKTTLKHYTSIAGSERRSAVDQTVRAIMEAAKSETKH